jgi:hypothetical protein
MKGGYCLDLVQSQKSLRNPQPEDHTVTAAG